MKTLFRILVVLFVAALLGGMMYAAAQAGGARIHEREFDEERPALPEGGIRPEREGGAGLPFGVVKSLVVMSLVGVPFFFWRKQR